MFTAMRNDLEKKQTEQREAEERQIKLRQKWQEQREQDLLRLQHSRQSSSFLMSTKQDSKGAVDAGFRLRRIHRESCRELTEELQFGVSVRREFKEAKELQFFHFYYLPEGHGSIITLKMHVLRGDAEVFMSTDTKVPCSTDFTWRSSERLAKDSDEGHRITLYPHDLLKAANNAACTKQRATLGDANASFRSLNAKQDPTSLRVGFYLSVVALEPGTAFTLAVMSSGQKMQPSRAIQTVDYLIDRFNMLSRSFQEHSTDAENSEEESTDAQELKSFQRLLETLSEKKGVGSPRVASILLCGPTDEHLEFVQDEYQRLQDMHRLVSPPETCPENFLGHHDAVSAVTERRLTLQGKRQKRRRVVAARLHQKLAPLRHNSFARSQLEKSASTGALVDFKDVPHPVAYSITTLDPLSRSQRLKAAIIPLPQARRSTNKQVPKNN
ncbi:uncharacterized protein PITG_05334 [Phytophthora infestans T30-4]|uniref:Uncharacterized protein n=1 Tax=Phytophthora infestans (strain T30-4) TaxID=403677 RepID=D0N441_PHYIT|nr:uncharacterized protein PITG_05334 [Phytophthora infestans T30-4]EEY69145.1 conserved hypothetical protein [Phytophthora infestans T30-4]|eukprot:XP_002998999.1 conserved hypothetical protein [Phytophthora infestans T30-4]